MNERNAWSHRFYQWWNCTDLEDMEFKDVGPQLEFGISNEETYFLFYQHDGRCRDAMTLTKKQAIARLRKFLYYKMRKAELLEDYEGARRIEGNQGYTTPTESELVAVHA